MKVLIILGIILLSGCGKDKCDGLKDDSGCKKDCQSFTTMGGYTFLDRFGMQIQSSYSGQYTLCREVK